MATTWISRGSARASTRTVHAIPLTLVLLLAAAAAYGAGRHVAGVVTATLGLAVLARWAGPRLGDWRRLRRAVARRRSRSGIPGARESLRRLGVDDATINELLAGDASAGERTIAELDQNNRMLSQIGPIPLFANTLVDDHGFRTRSRNRTRIVVWFDRLAVRKDYTERRRFGNEVRALDALMDLREVPTLLEVDRRARIAYQTFFPGRNLGSLMADSGAGVSAQHQLGAAFRGSGDAALREQVLRSLRRTVDDDFIAAMQRLVVQVHQRGVLLRDVKHGNVIVCDEGPRLCDFDLARVFRRNDVGTAWLRAEERERFNYLFGGDLMTPARFRAALDSWIVRNPDLQYPGVYFGKGFRAGGDLTPLEGTGRWLRLKRHLPEFRGRRVIDLSGGTGVLALEVLRAGARSALTCEPDERLTELARLHHRFVEFVDNRDYDFSIMTGDVGPEHLGSSLDGIGEAVLLMALRTPFATRPTAWERGRQFVRGQDTRIRSVVVECGAANEAASVRDDLAKAGFIDQYLVELPAGDTILAIAHRKSD